MRDKMRFVLKADFCISFAIMLMLFPVTFCFSWVLAALFHELCHYMMLRICGSSVYSVQVGMGGTIMETQPLTAGREVLCALAGPIGGLSLLLFARWIPRIAVCAFLQSMYNLLPIFPLDGGRAVRGILSVLFSAQTASKASAIIAYACLIILTVLSFWATLHLSLGVIPIFVCAIVLLKRIKIPCKQSILQVQ